MNELRESHGGRCKLGLDGCWETQGLEFAHVKETGLNGRGRGLPQRYNDIRKHPKSYLLVCRNCHAKADGLAETFHNYDLQEEPPF